MLAINNKPGCVDFQFDQKTAICRMASDAGDYEIILDVSPYFEKQQLFDIAMAALRRLGETDIARNLAEHEPPEPMPNVRNCRILAPAEIAGMTFQEYLDFYCVNIDPAGMPAELIEPELEEFRRAIEELSPESLESEMNDGL